MRGGAVASLRLRGHSRSRRPRADAGAGIERTGGAAAGLEPPPLRCMPAAYRPPLGIMRRRGVAAIGGGGGMQNGGDDARLQEACQQRRAMLAELLAHAEMVAAGSLG